MYFRNFHSTSLKGDMLWKQNTPESETWPAWKTTFLPRMYHLLLFGINEGISEYLARKWLNRKKSVRRLLQCSGCVYIVLVTVISDQADFKRSDCFKQMFCSGGGFTRYFDTEIIIVKYFSIVKVENTSSSSPCDISGASTCSYIFEETTSITP